MDFIDPICVQDVFSSRMVSAEDLGGVIRFTFTCQQGGEQIIVARIVMLASAVPDAWLMTAEAIGESAEDPTSLRPTH